MEDKKTYTITDFYLYYLLNIDRDTVYEVPYTTYKSILLEYFKYIASLIMDKSYEVKLPCRLGTISIIKRKPKNFNSKSLRIDYHESAIQNKAIYFINEHSNYYKYRFYWCKLNCITTNKGKYLFIASRANKRRLAQIIKNKEHDYVEVK